MVAPVDLSHHYSFAARRRKANVYKLFYKYYDIPNISDISGGLPHASLFPVDTLQAETADPDRLSDSQAPEHLVSASHNELETGLQYGQITGLPAMAQWVDEFTRKYIAKPLYQPGFRTLVTMGSTDGWNKALQVLSNEWHEGITPVEYRDGLLVEQFTYSCAVEAARVRGLNILPLEMDEYGITPEGLEKLLVNWQPKDGKRPHLMYTISLGQNPTGATMHMERRKKIYSLCCQYDIVIVEDEPYWFMQYDGKNEKCYLDIDTDGRVLRLDSFSKNFAPGCRLGWVTGQPDLVERIHHHGEESTQMPSGFAQIMVLKTLQEWGYDGWMTWLRNLCAEYQSRRDLMVEGLSPYCLSKSNEVIIEFKPPQAGMFIWARIHFENHRLHNHFSVIELSRAFWVYQTRGSTPTLVSPGYMFAPVLSDAEHMARYVRMSFAPSEKSVLKPAAEHVGQAAQKFWEIENVDTMRELVSAFPVL